jgi:predicted RNase H-like HicB family nuclease
MTKRYLVVYGKCKGSNFSGYAPDVLGCVSVGDTLEEMSAMLREALEMHIELTTQDGEPIPEPRTTNVEFKPEDFEDVEYFVVQHLDVAVPDVNRASSTESHQAA